MAKEETVAEKKPQKSKRKRTKYPEMPESERKAWNELDMFIRKNVMGYDDVKGLTRHMVLRLKGLRWGHAVANSNCYKHSDYTFDTILTTYKAYIYEIRRSMANKTFDNDEYKFAYALKIVENHIPEIYQRMKNLSQAQKDAEQLAKDISSDDASNDFACSEFEFKRVKENARRQKMFEEFW